MGGSEWGIMSVVCKLLVHGSERKAIMQVKTFLNLSRDRGATRIPQQKLSQPREFASTIHQRERRAALSRGRVQWQKIDEG
jgi:hypothetical protein